MKSADKLAASIKATIDADIASVPKHPGKTLTAYYELSIKPYYSLTSSTFVGALLKSLGVTNIADSQNTSADAGYPELSAEYIVSSNPKIIFLADTVSVKAVGVNGRAAPGLVQDRGGPRSRGDRTERRHRVSVGTALEHPDESAHGRGEGRAEQSQTLEVGA